MSVNDITGGDLEDRGDYSTLNITTGASASTFANLECADVLARCRSWQLDTDIALATALHIVSGTATASLSATCGGSATITQGAGASVIDTGAGTDQVNITAANIASNTVLTLFVNAGDKLGVAALWGAAAFTGTMGAQATGATIASGVLNLQ